MLRCYRDTTIIQEVELQSQETSLGSYTVIQCTRTRRQFPRWESYTHCFGLIVGLHMLRVRLPDMRHRRVCGGDHVVCVRVGLRILDIRPLELPVAPVSHDGEDHRANREQHDLQW